MVFAPGHPPHFVWVKNCAFPSIMTADTAPLSPIRVDVGPNEAGDVDLRLRPETPASVEIPVRSGTPATPELLDSAPVREGGHHASAASSAGFPPPPSREGEEANVRFLVSGEGEVEIQPVTPSSAGGQYSVAGPVTPEGTSQQDAGTSRDQSTEQSRAQSVDLLEKAVGEATAGPRGASSGSGEAVVDHGFDPPAGGVDQVEEDFRTGKSLKFALAGDEEVIWEKTINCLC